MTTMASSISKDSFMFTVGKLDAGMAILLGERAHLIEFPSLLLPPGTTTGSIVNISVTQNHAEEKRRDNAFWDLQNQILETFGRHTPQPPKLQLRNVTQTSVTLEWPPLELATAKLRSLDIYKNGQRLAAIPSPLQNTSTKLSGLELNTDYTFQLVLRTTASTYPSDLLRVRTHTMQDTSGISVCFGNVQDAVLLENAKLALREMNAKWSDKIQIDTTQFVCTTPAATPSGAEPSGSLSGAPGVEYQRALQLSIPVVQPQWILACHAEKKMIPISSYYLGATPSAPMSSTPFTRPQSMSQVPNSPNRVPASPNRASMPAAPRSTTNGVSSSPAAQKQHQKSESTPEEPEDARAADEEPEKDSEGKTTKSGKRRTRHGTMDRAFKFPSEDGAAGDLTQDLKSPPPPPVPQDKSSPSLNSEAAKAEPAANPAQEGTQNEPPLSAGNADESGMTAVNFVAPSSVEVPPPPPVEKEKAANGHEEGEEEVGETEEISLN